MRGARGWIFLIFTNSLDSSPFSYSQNLCQVFSNWDWNFYWRKCGIVIELSLLLSFKSMRSILDAIFLVKLSPYQLLYVLIPKSLSQFSLSLYSLLSCYNHRWSLIQMNLCLIQILAISCHRNSLWIFYFIVNGIWRIFTIWNKFLFKKHAFCGNREKCSIYIERKCIFEINNNKAFIANLTIILRVARIRAETKFRFRFRKF